MSDIAIKVEKWRSNLRSQCKKGCIDYCKEKSSCALYRLAEVLANIEFFIPEEYQQLTIDDFTGMKNGKQVLKTEAVASAKNTIVKYCWQGIEEGEDYDRAKWFPRSIMDRRRQAGTNLVIYGNSWQRTVVGREVKTFKAPLGRTMLAAIVLKEAINLRFKSNIHLTDKYCWAVYQTMVNRLMEHARGTSDYSQEIWNYEMADWLVVDGLEIMKDNGSNFRASVLDKLFGERLDKGLPTILVFQDDISDSEDIRNEFGIHISNIVNNSKTYSVRLLNK